MRRLWIQTVCFAAILNMFSSIKLNAQRNDIYFEHLSIEHGLAQSSVQCILQDSRGFMWFGTEDGLNRYDGYNFVEYRHNPYDPYSLSHSFVRSILEDSRGIIWVGTERGLNRFDRNSEQFTRYEYDPNNPHGISKNRVLDIFEDHLGTLWIGTEGGGLDKLVPGESEGSPVTFVHYRNDPDDPTSLSSNAVFSIYEDRNMNLWIATHDGLNRFNRETEQCTHFRHDPKDPGSISENNIWCICEDFMGHLWFGTYETGISRLDSETGKFTHYRYDPEDPNSLRSNQVWTIFEDRRRILWIGTLGGGLHRYDREGDHFIHYRFDSNDPHSLSHNQVASLYEDKSGLLWVGTFGGGLNIYNRKRKPFFLFRHEMNNPNSLSGQYVSSFYEDETGMIWIGTYDGGLNALNREEKIFSHFQHDPENQNSLSHNSVGAVTGDRRGNLWIGTYGGGLNRFHPTTGQFTHYRSDADDPSSLSVGAISSICKDHNGELWIGTWGGGLNRLKPGTGRFEHYRFDPGDSNSISNDAVLSVYEDRTGVIWAGTQWGGLNKFHRPTETFTRYEFDPENPYSLSHTIVLTMYMDTSGFLWVGTQGGLNKFDLQTERFTHYREKDGLPSDFIHGILDDDHGNLWISTARGLTKFNPQTETFKNFDVNDGLQDNMFFARASLKTKSGEMLFGGRNGFNMFHPDSIKSNPYIPPIVITDFQIFNKTVNPMQGTILEQTISETEAIELSHKENVFSFEFAALDYTSPEANHYAYMMGGFDEDWIYSGNRRFVNYSNLPAGKYTFRVKGSNSDRVWNEEGTSLRITIFPPWWKTWWAYCLYLIAAFAIVYGVVRFEKNREREKARIREAELRVQAAEAEARAFQVENERKTHELEEARKLQLSMLPKEMPQLPNLEIAVFMKTANEVGGDYYDFHQAKDGAFTVAIGDATGHGMKAGNMVVSMKSLFNTLPDEMTIPDFFNKCTIILKNMHMEQLYMCMAMVRIKDNTMNVSTAGMPPILVYRSKTQQIEELGEGGIPLGWIEGFSYRQIETKLLPGDTILLMTDGLAELFNDREEMLDYPRIKDIFAKFARHSPEELIEHLADAGEKWRNGIPQNDDITFVVLKVKPTKAGLFATEAQRHRDK